MVPCLSKTNPLPVPAPVGPLTFNWTTDGSTFSTRSAKSKVSGRPATGAGFDSAGFCFTEPSVFSTVGTDRDSGVGAAAWRAFAFAKTVGDFVPAAGPLLTALLGVLLVSATGEVAADVATVLLASLTCVLRPATNATLATLAISTSTSSGMMPRKARFFGEFGSCLMVVVSLA